jgi:putative component of membrane protein insertase Oxa1/YidC/SpoIIIJ protein YidD
VRIAAALALAAIRCYQRFISPYKGFSCALRVATGGDSCSAYGHAVIARFGLRRGLGLLDRRLALCGHVHRQMPRPPAPVLHPRVRHQRGFCDAPCDMPCDGPGHCHFPCDGHHHCGGTARHLPCDVFDVCDVCNACDGCDAWKRWRERRGPRDTRDLDAAAERIRRQRARRTAPDPATRATESSPAATD